MKREETLKKFGKSLIDLNRAGVQNALKTALKQGVSATTLIDEMRKASEVIGKRWEEQKYFISELIIAGVLMKEVTDELRPKLVSEGAPYRGKVVIGSAPGDLHDIGKNLTALCLMGAGFNVIDIGANPTTEKFVETVRREKPQIVGISALTSTTMLSMGEVVRSLQAVGLRDKLKVVIGGAPMTDAYAKSVGADAYATDAIQGVKICQKWTQP
jgi:5-methyltetrahydrofolate--homocysteine methyltransferase